MAEEEEEEERREENMFERRMKEGRKFNAATPTTGITKAGEHNGKEEQEKRSSDDTEDLHVLKIPMVSRSSESVVAGDGVGYWGGVA